MIAGSVAVMVFAGRRPDPKAAIMPAPRAHERPWLTRDANDQIVGPGGVLGPLFADVTLGGDPPSPETRERIAEFARENHVDINFDVAHHELRAISFGVTFGGCCGYEAADSLGARLERPKKYDGSDRRGDWVDDWSFAIEGVHVQANVNVNRVELRWEPTITLDEMLDRAESLVGKTRASIREVAGDHFIESVGRYLLEVPYPFMRAESYMRSVDGFELVFDHGRVSDVSIALQSPADSDLLTSLRARWGKSHIDEDSTTTWHVRNHTIKAILDLDRARLTISQ
jgi:hypothetical protein